MNCPACKSPLVFREKLIAGIVIPAYYAVDCNSCGLIWGSASYPNKVIDDYELIVQVDGYEYVFWACFEDGGFSEIWKDLSNKQALRLERYYPVVEDISFYEKLIRKTMNLKVFL